MGSTSYDKFFDALDPGPRPSRRQIGAIGTLQPTAEISEIARYINPPLADVPFKAGGAGSATVGVGEWNVITIAPVNIAAGRLTFDQRVQVGCWFWFQINGDSVNNPAAVAGHFRSLDNMDKVVGVLAGDNGTDMSEAVARRELVRFTSNSGYPVGTPNFFLHITPPDSNPGPERAQWQGPYYCPRDLAPCWTSYDLVDAQAQLNVNVRWIEEPNPIRTG